MFTRITHSDSLDYSSGTCEWSESTCLVEAFRNSETGVSPNASGRLAWQGDFHANVMRRERLTDAAQPAHSNTEIYMSRKNASEFLNSFDPKAAEAIADLNAKFPDLAIPFSERLYGEVYQRDTLNLRERLLVTVATLAGSGNMEPQLPMQLNIALKNGVSREDLMEVALQISLFYGFARAMNLAMLVDSMADELEIAQTEANP
jgi:4-carboxymuconolactone decarboxylase